MPGNNKAVSTVITTSAENGNMFGEEYTLVACADYVLSRTPGNTVSNMSSSRALRDISEKYIKEFQSSIYKSYGAVMRGYVLIPEHMLEDLDNLAKYLNESYDYVMSLEPK